MLSRWGRWSSLSKALSTASVSIAVGRPASPALVLLRIRLALLLSTFCFDSSRTRSEGGGGVERRPGLGMDGGLTSLMALLDDGGIAARAEDSGCIV